MNSDRGIAFASSSIGSSSSFSSSKSSLFVLDDSQSDNSMPRGDISQYNIAASPSPLPSTSIQQQPFQPGIIASTASTTQKIKRAFGKRRKQSQDASSLLAVISSPNSPNSPSPLPKIASSSPWPTESQSTPSPQPSTAKLSMNIFNAKKHNQASNSSVNDSMAHSPTQFSSSPLSKSPQSQSHHSVASQLQPRPTVLHTNYLPPLPPPKPRPKKHLQTQNGSSKSPFPSPPNTSVAAEHIRIAHPPLSSDYPEYSETSASASEETKELWRRSDSTMDSGHTVRPVASSGTPSESRRVSAYLIDNDDEEENFLWKPAIQSEAPPSSAAASTAVTPNQPQERPSTAADFNPPSKQTKRRSLSLTIPSTSSNHQRSPPHLQSHYSNASSSHASTNSIPFTSFASAANIADVSIIPHGPSISPASIVIQPPKNNNIRGRFAAWAHPSYRTPSPSPIAQAAQASTSSPSLLTTTSTVSSSNHVRTPLVSDASQADLQAVSIVRQMQSRVRSPSSSSLSSSAGHIRQAATSLTSNAGAMAFGLGKKAYEKVGKVLGGGGSSHAGSGSGSDTSSYHHPSPVNMSPMQLYPSGQDRSHGPSAFNARRSPNSSGSWSIPSQSVGSRSSSERDGRDTPSSFSSLGSRPMGRLVRAPRAPSGLVFKRALWECVKDTKTSALSTNDPLAMRMIPALIYRCVQHMYKWGLEEEGLFRISGRAGHIARLRNDFDGGADYDITDCPPSDLDPHAVASVFKAYLRELPEMILTRALSALFDSAINADNTRTSVPIVTATGGRPTSPVSLSGVGLLGRPQPSLRKPPSLSTFTLPNSSTLRAPSTTLINTLRGLVSRLPRENHDLLLTVVELIRATAAKSSITKMPLSNLLLVFCPSLNMSPPLLRVLCDVPSIWASVAEDNAQSHSEMLDEAIDDEEDSKDNDDEALYSDALSVDDANQDIEGRGSGDEVGTKAAVDLADTTAMTSTTKVTTIDTPSQIDIGLEITADEDVILIPSSKARQNRQQQRIRRVPVPPLDLGAEEDMQGTKQNQIEAVSNSPSTSDDGQTLPHSDSTTSFHSSESMQNPNSNSQTASQVSLLSSEGDADVEMGMNSGPRINNSASRFNRISPNQSPKTSSPLAPYFNYDKSLPASPRTPSSLSTFSTTVTGLRATTPPPENALTRIRGPNHKSNKSSHSKQRRADRIGSFSSPSLLGSSGASVPSVVFPSIGASWGPNTSQGSVTPNSLKKLTISLAQRNSKVLDGATAEDEGAPSPASPSPSKRMGRRPSLNLLFNMKHGSSGSTSLSSSPRSRTPTISGPILFQNVGGGGGWEEVLPANWSTSPAVVSDAPPMLSLGMDSGESALGWEDVFRVTTAQGEGEPCPVPSTSSPSSLSLPIPPPACLTITPQPRPVAISQPTLPAHQSQTPSTQFPSQPHPQIVNSTVTASSRRPTTEYLLSSNDFAVDGPPELLPTPATIPVQVDSDPEELTKERSESQKAIVNHVPSLSTGGAITLNSPYDKSKISSGNHSSSSFKNSDSGLRSFPFVSPVHSPPPHISFQLRGSSQEEEDWASAVLLMASGGNKSS